MRILHLTKAQQTVSTWSGGTTTQLFIWPENADYASREFQLRISSATVELAESDFTSLPGVERYIIPLDGSFTLTHPLVDPIFLDPWATPYRFCGETPTHCVGVATDFNLMLKGVEGNMEICSGEQCLQPGFHGLYPQESCTWQLNGLSYQVQPGELLVLFLQESLPLSLPCPTIHCWAKL